MGSAQVRLEAASIRRTPLSAYHTVLLETFSFGFSKGNPVDSWGYSGCCMAALPVCLRGSQPEKNGLGRRTDWGSLLLGGCFFWKCPKTMVFRLRGPRRKVDRLHWVRVHRRCRRKPRVQQPTQAPQRAAQQAQWLKQGLKEAGLPLRRFRARLLNWEK